MRFHPSYRRPSFLPCVCVRRCESGYRAALAGLAWALVLSTRGGPCGWTMSAEQHAGSAGPSIVDVICQAMETLESDPESLVLLCEAIEESYGDDGTLAGAAFRECDGPKRLSALLSWWNMLAPSATHLADVAELRTIALELISNLCSDAVDVNSSETKQELLKCGAELPLLACLKGTDEQVVRLACAAMQNLCADLGWAEVVSRNGAHLDLERLLEHSDPSVVKFASGALRNLQVALASADMPVPSIPPKQKGQSGRGKWLLPWNPSRGSVPCGSLLDTYQACLQSNA